MLQCLRQRKLSVFICRKLCKCHLVRAVVYELYIFSFSSTILKVAPEAFMICPVDSSTFTTCNAAFISLSSAIKEKPVPVH